MRGDNPTGRSPLDHLRLFADRLAERLGYVPTPLLEAAERGRVWWRDEAKGLERRFDAYRSVTMGRKVIRGADPGSATYALKPPAFPL